MKKTIGIIVAVVLVAAVAFASYKLGEKNVKIMDDPTVTSKTTENVQEPPDPQEDERIPVDDMSVEEISRYLRGKVFQQGDPYMGSGLGEVFCFTPEGNTCYWFCSSMDEQSRVRAEYGTWALQTATWSLPPKGSSNGRTGISSRPPGAQAAGSRWKTMTRSSLKSASKANPISACSNSTCMTRKNLSMAFIAWATIISTRPAAGGSTT